MNKLQINRTRNTHISYDILYKLYVKEDKRAVDIADIYGMHHTTILRRLRKFGIPIRTNKEIHSGKINSEETRVKMRESAKGNQKWLGKNHLEKSKDKMRQYRLGSKIPVEIRKKMSATHKEKFKDPEYKARVVKAVHQAQKKSPNGCETIIKQMLDEIQPNVWEFVGDWDIDLGSKNPDFWNGEDKFIEHFGIYWHGERARCYEETEQGRIEHFAKYGFKTLIIWEVELKHQPEIVKARIKEFISS